VLLVQRAQGKSYLLKKQMSFVTLLFLFRSADGSSATCTGRMPVRHIKAWPALSRRASVAQLHTEYISDRKFKLSVQRGDLPTSESLRVLVDFGNGDIKVGKSDTKITTNLVQTRVNIDQDTPISVRSNPIHGQQFEFTTVVRSNQSFEIAVECLSADSWDEDLHLEYFFTNVATVSQTVQKHRNPEFEVEIPPGKGVYSVEVQAPVRIMPDLAYCSAEHTPGLKPEMNIILVGTAKTQFPLQGYGGSEAHVEAMADGLHHLIEKQQEHNAGTRFKFFVVCPAHQEETSVKLFSFPFKVIRTSRYMPQRGAQTNGIEIENSAQYMVEVRSIVKDHLDQVDGRSMYVPVTYTVYTEDVVLFYFLLSTDSQSPAIRDSTVLLTMSEWAADALHHLGVPIICTLSVVYNNLQLYSNVMYRFCSRCSQWWCDHSMS
jgi:hypothetical protein